MDTIKDNLRKFDDNLSCIINSLPDNLSSSFDKLYNSLVELEPIKLQIFTNANFKRLFDTRHGIGILIKESRHFRPYHNADPKLLTHIYYKLFIEIKHTFNVSTIFKDFTKGITCFGHCYYGHFYYQDDVYDRLFSCGDGSRSFRKTILRDDMNKKTLFKKIKTCFVERLIYENIYMYFNKITQGQTYFLKRTKNDFNVCFPGIDIKIKIKYTQLRPIYLMVITLLNGKIIYTEEYFKFLNKDKVLFIKRNKHKTYTTCLKKFEKKDEDNKPFFKLMEINNEYTKPYSVICNSDFDFDLFLN
jgi:hypothetical protein